MTMCSSHTRLDRWGWGLQPPLPVGQGAVRNPGSSQHHRQPGVTWTGLSLVRGGHWPRGAEHGNVASPKTHILIFFGFESFKPKFKFWSYMRLAADRLDCTNWSLFWVSFAMYTATHHAQWTTYTDTKKPPQLQHRRSGEQSTFVTGKFNPYPGRFFLFHWYRAKTVPRKLRWEKQNPLQSAHYVCWCPWGRVSNLAVL